MMGHLSRLREAAIDLHKGVRKCREMLTALKQERAGNFSISSAVVPSGSLISSTAAATASSLSIPFPKSSVRRFKASGGFGLEPALPEPKAEFRIPLPSVSVRASEHLSFTTSMFSSAPLKFGKDVTKEAVAKSKKANRLALTDDSPKMRSAAAIDNAGDMIAIAG
jgi:hypothetical protein